MPNIKSAAKRMRTSERKRQRNRSTKSAIRSSRQTVLQALSKDAATAEDPFRAYCSSLDKATKKGIVPRNTSNRHKQRMARKLNAALKTS